MEPTIKWAYKVMCKTYNEKYKDKHENLYSLFKLTG